MVFIFLSESRYINLYFSLNRKVSKQLMPYSKGVWTSAKQELGTLTMAQWTLAKHYPLACGLGAWNSAKCTNQEPAQYHGAGQMGGITNSLWGGSMALSSVKASWVEQGHQHTGLFTVLIGVGDLSLTPPAATLRRAGPAFSGAAQYDQPC